MDPAVTKMVIEIYKDGTYAKKEKQYPVLFNPENYTLDFAFSFKSDETAMGGNTQYLFQSIARSQFTMTFFIDGTGIGAAALGRDKIVVVDEIWKFMETTTIMNRNGTRKKEAPFCQLVWGPLCKQCLVLKVNLKIKLLDRTGKPLRAELETTFQTNSK